MLHLVSAFYAIGFTLLCGRQCLGGETCREDYCQMCAARGEARADLLEMKHEEINADEAPIMVLGYGHLFTAETLEGLIEWGMYT